MILFRFRGEPGDDVRGKGDVRNQLANLCDPLHVVFHRIGAVHQLQHAVGAGLHRQMDVVADVPPLRHRLDQLVRHVLRMRCRIADPDFRIDRGCGGKQVGKILPLPPVAVHVLPQQRHLPETVIAQVLHLVDDGDKGTAPLASAGKGNNAEGAELVAAAHHRYPCGNPFGPHRGYIVVGLHAGELYRKPLFAVAGLVHQFRQGAVLVGADHHIDHGLGRQQILAQAFGHATENADHEFRVFLFEVGDMVQPVVNALLGVIANGAGVEQNHVRLLDPVGGIVSVVVQNGQNDLRIGNVHLAAVGLHIDFLLRCGALRRIPYRFRCCVHGRSVCFLSVLRSALPGGPRRPMSYRPEAHDGLCLPA